MDNAIKNVFEDINNIFISKLQETKSKINDSIEIELFNDCIDTYTYNISKKIINLKLYTEKNINKI